jgi:hypothetical protein
LGLFQPEKSLRANDGFNGVRVWGEIGFGSGNVVQP